MGWPISSSNNKLKWICENFSSLDERIRFSPDFECQGGIKWNIGLKKRENVLESFLACKINPTQKSWICLANIKLTIICPDSTKNHHIGTYGNKVLWHEEYQNTLGLPSDISPFLIDNSLTFRIDLEFIFYDFSEKIENYTDILLMVDNVEIHLNKGELCINSRYFHDFYAREKSTDQIFKVENENLKDVLLLLTTMYPATLITSGLLIDNTFKSSPLIKSPSSTILLNSGVLELADKWQFHTIHWKIAMGMMTILELMTTQKNFTNQDAHYLIKCIKFGDKYEYFQIVNLAISCFTTSAEIKTASEWSDFEDISKDTRHKIFQRLLQLL